MCRTASETRVLPQPFLPAWPSPLTSPQGRSEVHFQFKSVPGIMRGQSLWRVAWWLLCVRTGGWGWRRSQPQAWRGAQAGGSHLPACSRVTFSQEKVKVSNVKSSESSVRPREKVWANEFQSASVWGGRQWWVTGWGGATPPARRRHTWTRPAPPGSPYVGSALWEPGGRPDALA